MSAATAWNVEGLSDSALIGWRTWRVLPFETLHDGPSFRLCAAGTRGIPKVWQPRRAVEAVCSDFASKHDAPWPAHECGIYAYRERAAAESHQAIFTETNGGGAVGWAFGQVALWGRVVECERGWRAQFAYPYAVTVHGPPELASAIRDLYAIDVEAAEPLPPAPPEQEEPPAPSSLAAELEKAQADVRKALRLLGRPLPAPAAVVAPWRSDDADECPPLAELAFTDEDLLLALFRAHYAYGSWCGAAPIERVWRELLAAHDLTPGKFAHSDRDDRTRIGELLQPFEEVGLLVVGSYKGYAREYFRFTEAGIERLLGLPLPVMVEPRGDGSSRVSKSASSAEGVEELRRPSEPFAWEIERDKRGWIAERKAALAKGRASYVRWLAEWRRESEARSVNRLFYDDDEILAALAQAVRGNAGQPVFFSAMVAELAPGKPTRHEASWLSSRLVALHGAGRLTRTETQPRLWKEGD